MASQITHVAYGEKVLNKFLADLKIERRDFFVGTLFPDIRYLVKVEREVTHQGDVSIQYIRNIKSDFEKGRLTHCLVDLERERVFRELGIYELVGERLMIPSALKYLEDEVTYPLVKDWKKFREYLNQGVLVEEMEWVDEQTVIKWHGLLADYFSQVPTLENALKMAENLILTEEQLNQAAKLTEQLRENTELISRIKRVYDSIFAD